MDGERVTRAIAADKKTEDAVQVEVYDDFEQLHTIQQEWDDFMESVGAEIFLTYDWCRIWWKYYGKKRKLRVFVFLNKDNKIVGIIPLFFEKLWLGPVLVRAAKIVASDFTGDQFCMPVHSQYIRSVLRKFFELFPRDQWDILHIGPIAGLYEHYDDLNNACEELLGHSHLILSEDKGVQTYFELANTWEECLAGLKKKQRQAIRRNYREIGNETDSLTARFAHLDDFAEKFDGFEKMHQLQWRKVGKSGHFGDWPNSADFHREVAQIMLKEGRLRLLKVNANEFCFGYQYAYRFGDKLYSVLSARSMLGKMARVDMGKVIYCEQMKKAIDENVTYIDSMRGKYEHKLRLGGKLFPIRSLYIIPKKLSTVVRVYTFRAFARFLNVLYYKIWFCRLAPRLPFRRRPLWQMWIRSSVFH